MQYMQGYSVQQNTRKLLWSLENINAFPHFILCSKISYTIFHFYLILSRKNLERHKSQHYHNIMKNIQASEKGKINNIKFIFCVRAMSKFLHVIISRLKLLPNVDKPPRSKLSQTQFHSNVCAII